MNELERYVQQQLVAGRSKEQIRQILLQHGYDQNTVNTVLPQDSTTSSVSSSSSTNDLDSYVQKYISTGYSPQQLFDYLLSQGYNQRDLENTFNRVAPNSIHITHHHDVSNTAFLKFGGILIVVAIILAGGYFAFLSGGGEEIKLLDLSADSSTYTYEPGTPLSFRMELLNQGDSNRVDIYFTYTIYTDSGNRVIRKQETRAFETTMRDVITMQLPDDMVDGRYSLEVIASYAEQEAIASFDFFIGDSSSPNPNPNPVPDPINPEPTPIPTPTPLPTPITPPDSQGLSDDQLMINALDSNDPAEGAGICDAISQDYLKNECFLLLAQTHNNYQYCEYINDLSRKEDCYIDFVLMGSVELCSQITLPENQILCSQFTNMNYIVLYGQDGNVSGLMNYLGITPLPPANNSPDKLSNLDIGDFVT